MFVNSYAQNLYEIQQKIREKSDTGQSQVKHENRHGAEKIDKEITRKIEQNERKSEEAAHFNADLARFYRMGVNPPRSVLEQVYSKERERG